jgi:hypothetical protein
MISKGTVEEDYRPGLVGFAHEGFIHSQAVDKVPAAGCGGRHLRKTSAFSGVSKVEKDHG